MFPEMYNTIDDNVINLILFRMEYEGKLVMFARINIHVLTKYSWTITGKVLNIISIARAPGK